MFSRTTEQNSGDNKKRGALCEGQGKDNKGSTSGVLAAERGGGARQRLCCAEEQQTTADSKEKIARRACQSGQRIAAPSQSHA